MTLHHYLCPRPLLLPYTPHLVMVVAFKQIVLPSAVFSPLALDTRDTSPFTPPGIRLSLDL